MVGTVVAVADSGRSTICEGKFTEMEQVLSFVLLSAPSRAGVNAPQESSLRNLRHPCSRLRLSGVAQDGDIGLNKGMTNARVNLAEGRSPGAGLESAFDQADAAFADLIVTSVDDQGLNLDDEEVDELAKGGMMDEQSKSKKSEGFFGEVFQVFDALGGGAHIIRREDGSL